MIKVIRKFLHKCSININNTFEAYETVKKLQKLCLFLFYIEWNVHRCLNNKYCKKYLNADILRKHSGRALTNKVAIIIY